MDLKNATFIPKKQRPALKDTPMEPQYLQYERCSFIIDDSTDKTNSGMPSGQVMEAGRVVVTDDFFEKVATMALRFASIKDKN